jgi:hypothetical protein
MQFFRGKTKCPPSLAQIDWDVSSSALAAIATALETTPFGIPPVALRSFEKVSA